MRLKVTRSKNAASLYVIKSVYDSKTQSNTSKIVEKLGTEAELREKLHGADPYEWAKDYIRQLGCLTPLIQIISFKVNNDFIFLSNFKFPLPRYSTLCYNRGMNWRDHL